MRYYDTIETPKTGKTFLEAGIDRLPQTDSSVISWFEPLPEGYKRAYDTDGLPFNELIPPPPSPYHELINDAWVLNTELERLSTIPQSVSMRQARLALLSIGKLQIVEDAIIDEAARIEWDYAATVKRDHTLIAAIQPLLGMSETELDDLFVVAAGL